MCSAPVNIYILCEMLLSNLKIILKREEGWETRTSSAEHRGWMTLSDSSQKNKNNGSNPNRFFFIKKVFGFAGLEVVFKWEGELLSDQMFLSKLEWEPRCHKPDHLFAATALQGAGLNGRQSPNMCVTSYSWVLKVSDLCVCVWVYVTVDLCLSSHVNIHLLYWQLGKVHLLNCSIMQTLNQLNL